MFFRSAFHTTFKQRPHGLRPYVILLASVFIIEIFLINGKGPTMYLYLRKEFSWDESTFGRFIALFGVVGLFTQYVAVPFLTETCGLHDTTLGFLACIGCAIQQVRQRNAVIETHISASNIAPIPRITGRHCILDFDLLSFR